MGCVGNAAYGTVYDISYQFSVVSFQLFSAVWRDFFNRLRASSPRRLARPGQPSPLPGRYPLNTGERWRGWGRWMPAWSPVGSEQTESQWTPDTGSVGWTEERSATLRGHWDFSWIFMDTIDFIDAVVFMVMWFFCKVSRKNDWISTFSEKVQKKWSKSGLSTDIPPCYKKIELFTEGRVKTWNYLMNLRAI